MAKEKKEKKESKISLTKQELKKVSWPSIKDILKYTGATIVFVLILAGFFSLLHLGLSFVKGLFI